MKLRPFFISGIALLGSLSAMTLPVSEDSSSTAKAGGGQAKLTAAAGTAKTLPISSTRSAFVRFEAGSLAGNLPPEQVAGLTTEVAVLTADNGRGERALLLPEQPVPDGARVV